MRVEDLDTVMSVETRAYAFPWTRGIFADCIRSKYDCRVLCLNDEIVGHAVLSTAAGEAHLLNVCIRRDRQGRGLGRHFVLHIIKRACLAESQHLFLEVRPSNKKAIALYHSLGFVEVGVRRDYYPGDPNREDALVLSLDLSPFSEDG